VDDIVMPEVPEDELSDIPLHGKVMAYGTIKGGDHYNVLKVGPNYWKEMVRAYLACVSFVDAQAGKVLDALEASPYADNTIVVFWSDHGQHLGEKRHWRKQALWEESTRVPLSIRQLGFRQAGTSSKQAVSLIDIYPSLIDLVGLPAVKGLEGTSLIPQLKNPSKARTEPAVTTWYYKNHSVRDLHFRYIQYRDGSEELYDHRVDPLEHRNLAGDPLFAHVIKNMAKHIPTKNIVPPTMTDGGLDSYGKRVKTFQTEGVPSWLE
jgi:iduronate 2-sulfatase